PRCRARRIRCTPPVDSAAFLTQSGAPFHGLSRFRAAARSPSLAGSAGPLPAAVPVPALARAELRFVLLEHRPRLPARARPAGPAGQGPVRRPLLLLRAAGCLHERARVLL